MSVENALECLDYSPNAPLEQGYLSYKFGCKPSPCQETAGNQLYAHAIMRRFNTCHYALENVTSRSLLEPSK